MGIRDFIFVNVFGATFNKKNNKGGVLLLKFQL